MSLRLRQVQPLTDSDGLCRLLYDLERTLVLEVPPPLRSRLVPALESGDWDESLRGWLREEELLTGQRPPVWSDGPQPPTPRLTDLSLDLSGACNMTCVYCFEKDIHSRIGKMDEATAMASLDFFFERTAGAPKVALHFGSGEPLLGFELLRKVIDEASRRALQAGQRITFELTTNATLVNEEKARFLSERPFNVRVSCDGPPEVHNRFRPMQGGRDSYRAVERGLRLLVKHLPERLTVNSVISGGTRLKEVWEWAKRLGIRHYHVIKVGAYGGDQLNLREVELREFREDLEAICRDMLADLERGQTPLDYQPITKVVRRLMIPEPITRFCGVAGSYLGVASDGKVYPCFRHLGLERYRLGDVREGVDDGKRSSFRGLEAADVDSRPVCRDCWARYLCGGGCYADSTVYGPDRRQPQVQHCPFWRSEIAQAIRFFDELRTRDPMHCFRLFGDDPDTVLDSLHGDGDPAFLRRVNCS